MIAEGFGYESFEINCSVLLSKAAGLSSGFRDGCLEGKKKKKAKVFGQAIIFSFSGC